MYLILYTSYRELAIATKKKFLHNLTPKNYFSSEKKLPNLPPPFLKNNGHFLNRALTLTESNGKWIISSHNP